MPIVCRFPQLYKMAESHKRNHFVPVVYLKSWSGGDNQVTTLSLNDGLMRIQKPKKIAKKNNLYTLPPEFKFPDKKFPEKFLFNIWEKWWNDVLEDLPKSPIVKVPTIGRLMGFVIVQSFRTPKFIRENDELTKHLPDDDKVARPYQFTYFATKGFSEYSKNASIKIFKASGLKRFITSDNPATHWIEKPFEGKAGLLHGIALRSELAKNPNYYILCPISPEYIALVYPNLGLPDRRMESCTIRTVGDDIVRTYNEHIELGADKLLVVRSPNDLGPT